MWVVEQQPRGCAFRLLAEEDELRNAESVALVVDKDPAIRLRQANDR